MRKYKVVQFIDPLFPYEEFYPVAMDLREVYGLFHLTISEVRMRWLRYSKSMDTEWTSPSPSKVSKVFGVKLEEI